MFGATNCDPNVLLKQPQKKNEKEIAVNLVVSNTIHFPEYNFYLENFVPIVSPRWVADFINFRKCPPFRPYSPDPRYFFSGINCVVASLSQGDTEAIYGAIEAFGGQWTQYPTTLTTHIIATDYNHPYCKLSKQAKRSIKLVLPHWIDDCCRLRRRIKENAYQLPSPAILNYATIESVQETDLNNVALSEDSDYGAIHESIDDPYKDTMDGIQLISHTLFKGRRFYLGKDLGLSKRARNAAVKVIRQSGGTYTDTLIETDKPDVTNVYIGKFRSGPEYVKACKSNWVVGNLLWLYHMATNATWSSPLENMLHYPYVEGGLPEMKDYIVTTTNYFGHAKEYIMQLLKLLGAKTTGNLTAQNILLIAARPEGRKYLAAKHWGINVVNHLWLEDTYSKWSVQAFTKPQYQHYPRLSDLSTYLYYKALDQQYLKQFYDNDAAASNAIVSKPIADRSDTLSKALSNLENKKATLKDEESDDELMEIDNPEKVTEPSTKINLLESDDEDLFDDKKSSPKPTEADSTEKNDLPTDTDIVMSNTEHDKPAEQQSDEEMLPVEAELQSPVQAPAPAPVTTDKSTDIKEPQAPPILDIETRPDLQVQEKALSSSPQKSLQTVAEPTTPRHSKTSSSTPVSHRTSSHRKAKDKAVANLHENIEDLNNFEKVKRRKIHNIPLPGELNYVRSKSTSPSKSPSKRGSEEQSSVHKKQSSSSSSPPESPTKTKTTAKIRSTIGSSNSDGAGTLSKHSSPEPESAGEQDGTKLDKDSPAPEDDGKTRPRKRKPAKRTKTGKVSSTGTGHSSTKSSESAADNQHESISPEAKPRSSTTNAATDSADDDVEAAAKARSPDSARTEQAKISKTASALEETSPPATKAKSKGDSSLQTQSDSSRLVGGLETTTKVHSAKPFNEGQSNRSDSSTTKQTEEGQPDLKSDDNNNNTIITTEVRATYGKRRQKINNRPALNSPKPKKLASSSPQKIDNDNKQEPTKDINDDKKADDDNNDEKEKEEEESSNKIDPTTPSHRNKSNTRATATATTKQSARKSSAATATTTTNTTTTTTTPHKKTRIKLLLTGTEPPTTKQAHKLASSLNIHIVQNPLEATHIIPARVCRTEKFLVSLAKPLTFLNETFLKDAISLISSSPSTSSSSSIPSSPSPDAATTTTNNNTTNTTTLSINVLDPKYQFQDKESVKSFDITVDEMLRRAKEVHGTLFEGLAFNIVRDVKGGVDVFNRIVMAHGAKTCIPVLTRSSTTNNQKKKTIITFSSCKPSDNHSVILIAGAEHEKNLDPFVDHYTAKGLTPYVYTTDWIILSIITMKVEFTSKYSLLSKNLDK